MYAHMYVCLYSDPCQLQFSKLKQETSLTYKSGIWTKEWNVLHGMETGLI